MDLNDTVCIVTGASSGLGRATASHLETLGARVAWLDRQVESIVASSSSSSRWMHAVDVTDAAGMIAAFGKVVSELGAPRVLVNCAGVLGSAKVAKIASDGTVSPRDATMFSRVLEINLIGTFNAIRLFAGATIAQPALANGERGVIVNTSSIAADEGLSGQTAYAASKGAVAAMTLPLAREFGRHGIRVVDIKPGPFRTGIYEDIPLTTRDSMNEDSPFPGRPGEPSEYALLVESIVRNPMLNGTSIRLDGATRMREPTVRAGDGVS
jgi:3-hydroxyacyl-CoA dehydrogenase / 3-hydroxy-2-methylbutyryl-CoA dehydrogenase